MRILKFYKIEDGNIYINATIRRHNCYFLASIGIQDRYFYDVTSAIKYLIELDFNLNINLK